MCLCLQGMIGLQQQQQQQQQPSASLHSSQSEPGDLLAMSQRLLANSTAASSLSSQRLMGKSSLAMQQSFQPPASPGPPAVSPFQVCGLACTAV